HRRYNVPTWPIGDRSRRASARQKIVRTLPRNFPNFTSERATQWWRGNSARLKRRTATTRKPAVGTLFLRSDFGVLTGRKRPKKRSHVSESSCPLRARNSRPRQCRNDLAVQPEKKPKAQCNFPQLAKSQTSLLMRKTAQQTRPPPQLKLAA